MDALFDNPDDLLGTAEYLDRFAHFIWIISKLYTDGSNEHFDKKCVNYYRQMHMNQT
jgi:hypothetical protein